MINELQQVATGWEMVSKILFYSSRSGKSRKKFDIMFLKKSQGKLNNFRADLIQLRAERNIGGHGVPLVEKEDLLKT